MHSSKLTTATLLGLPNPVAAYFYCPSVNETGFMPSCCHAIVGQVGIWCESYGRSLMRFYKEVTDTDEGTSANIIGSLPNFECNTGPPLNVDGCCQSIGYENPDTNHGIYLCTSKTEV